MSSYDFTELSILGELKKKKLTSQMSTEDGLIYIRFDQPIWGVNMDAEQAIVFGEDIAERGKRLKNETK
jgi:hypothetical protein